MAPDMYLLDGDSESAVASWQATFSSTSDRTLVVGSKNTDVGVASASRPLGLKVVGAMDRLAIALNKLCAKPHGIDVSEPRARHPAHLRRDQRPRQQARSPRVSTGMTSQQPSLSASMNSMAPMSADGGPVSHGMTASTAARRPGRGRCPRDDRRRPGRHRAAEHDAAAQCRARRSNGR